MDAGNQRVLVRVFRILGGPLAPAVSIAVISSSVRAAVSVASGLSEKLSDEEQRNWVTYEGRLSQDILPCVPWSNLSYDDID